MDKLIAEGLAALCRGSEKTAALIGPRLSVIAGLLDRYAGEIERFNPRWGLVKVQDRAELVTRHILDSLAPLEHIAGLLGNRPLADAGSGAGLPGIPLAICLPGIPVTLIDRSGRRANFLRNTLAVLGLSSVTVEETEMERSPPGRFGVVAFRAFHPLEKTLLRSLFRLLLPAGPSSPAGVLAAYQGRREKTLTALETELEEASCTAELIPLSVPFLNEERHLAVIRPGRN
jgi:16S rRNA (guanine527-N7)-methyltransferase